MKKSQNSLTTLELILQSTATLFWKKGFEAVTFAEIAKKVGVSQPAIYSYVTNKMDLMRQVFLWSAENGRKFIDSKIDPRNRALENLKLYVEGNLHFFYEQKVQANSIIAMYYFGASHPEIRKLYESTRVAAISRLSVYLIQAQHEGKLQKNCEDSLSRALHVALVGYCYQSIYAQTKSEQKQILNSAWPTFEKLIHFYSLK